MKRKLGLLVLIALVFVGCTGMQRVMIEPVVTVGGSNTIAVIFFDNFTGDYAIAHEVEQRLVQTLSQYYRVVEPAETEAALVHLGLLRGQSPNREQAIRLGEMLGVDAIVMGEVSGYFAPVTQTAPYKENSRTIEGVIHHQWEISQVTRVMVGFTGRLMETRNGSVIYRLRVEGEGAAESKELVRGGQWLPEGQVPGEFWLPRPHNRDVPQARAAAVQQAVSTFTMDLMPTYHWQRVN